MPNQHRKRLGRLGFDRFAQIAHRQKHHKLMCAFWIYPFFSPDGQWLGFFANQKLKKVSINGGAGQTLADAPLANGVN